jgi:hypothetical protein
MLDTRYCKPLTMHEWTTVVAGVSPAILAVACLLAKAFGVSAAKS